MLWNVSKVSISGHTLVSFDRAPFFFLAFLFFTFGTSLLLFSLYSTCFVFALPFFVENFSPFMHSYTVFLFPGLLTCPQLAAYLNLNSWQVPIPVYSIITPCQRAKKIGVFLHPRRWLPLSGKQPTISINWKPGDFALSWLEHRGQIFHPTLSFTSYLFAIIFTLFSLNSTSHLFFGYYSFWILQCLICGIYKYTPLVLLGPPLRLRYVWRRSISFNRLGNSLGMLKKLGWGLNIFSFSEPQPRLHPGHVEIHFASWQVPGPKNYNITPGFLWKTITSLEFEKMNELRSFWGLKKPVKCKFGCKCIG